MTFSTKEVHVLNGKQRATVKTVSILVGVIAVIVLFTFGGSPSMARYWYGTIGIVAVVMSVVLAIRGLRDRRILLGVFLTLGLATAAAAALSQDQHPALATALWFVATVLILLFFLRRFWLKLFAV